MSSLRPGVNYGIITLLILLSEFAFSFQDEGLRKFRSFFNDQVSEYQYWLIHTQLASIINVDSVKSDNLPNKLRVDHNMVTLYLKATGAPEWLALKKEFAKKTSDSLHTALMEHFKSLMDLENNQASIIITGEGMLVKLYFGNDGKVESHATISKGTIEGTFNVRIDSTRFSKQEILNAKGTVGVIKKKIINLIKTDLSRNEYRPVIDGDKFRINEITTSENTIELKAMNFTKRVIPGNVLGIGFYEFLDYSFELIPDPKEKTKVEIKLKVFGKYGSGWFAPMDTRYKPMAPRYQNYLNIYVDDLKEAIRKLLQS